MTEISTVLAMASEIGKMDADAYYEEVTVERKHHNVGTYFLVKIPAMDKNGEAIKIKYGFANDKPQGYLETARSFAKRKSATMVMNCSTFSATTNRQVGIAIHNGEIIQELKREAWNYILGIKDDNTMKAFEPTTTVSEILAQGYTNALTGFIPLIEGGKLVSESVFAKRDVMIERHPRQAIGQDTEGNTYVFTTEGRRLDEKGWTAKECAQVMLDLGMTFGYMFDGGGSAQTVYNGMLINRITDDGGREERPTVGFLYVGKDMPTVNNASEALNPVGDVLKIVNDQIAEIEDDIEALRKGASSSDRNYLSKYYSSYGSDYGTSGAGMPAIWTTEQKFAHLFGVVAVSSLGKVFATLKDGLAPSMTSEFLVSGYGTSNKNLYKLRITSAGEMSAYLISGSGTTANLNLFGVVYPNY